MNPNLRLAFEAMDGTDDKITARVIDRQLHITIENPWAGDDEHGFGESACIELKADQAEQLGKVLLEMAEYLKEEHP